MDDLLIVRRSDPARYRSRRRGSEGAPLGANLGLTLGLALGLVFAVSTGPEGTLERFGVWTTLGLVLGLALGVLAGRFLKPSTSRRRLHRPPLYDGFPLNGDVREETAGEREA